MLKTKAETKNGLFPEHLKGIFMDSKKPMTTAAGASIVDYFNFQAAGPRCPSLSQDVWLIEKLAHFGREVTPKQRMHAKRAGAFGAVRELP